VAPRSLGRVAFDAFFVDQDSAAMWSGRTLVMQDQWQRAAEAVRLAVLDEVERELAAHGHGHLVPRLLTWLTEADRIRAGRGE
jgi:beta-lactamase class A